MTTEVEETERDKASREADFAGMVDGYDPCAVCGTDRSALAAHEPCPVDGDQREEES